MHANATHIDECLFVSRSRSLLLHGKKSFPAILSNLAQVQITSPLMRSFEALAQYVIAMYWMYLEPKA